MQNLLCQSLVSSFDWLKEILTVAEGLIPAINLDIAACFIIL